MMKTVLYTGLCICLFVTFTACSENTESTDNSEQTTDQEVVNEEPEEIVEESPFGNFSDLVGEWTVDAATAGVKLDLTFGEDGSFKQSMGPVQGVGTWSRIDDEHINIVTQNTKAEGQKWKVADLTESSVSFTWNLDSNPKTIPMTRVK